MNPACESPHRRFFRVLCAKRSKLLVLDIVLSSETLDPAGRINEFLLAGKERVAGGTNFHFNIPDGRSGLDNIPAGAGDFGHFVSGMNLLSHKNSV
jgi:hypothetical protein